MVAHSNCGRFVLRPTMILLLCILSTGCSVYNWIDSKVPSSKVFNEQSVPPFEVPPRQAGQKYLQFIAVGDVGTGADGQRDVAESMAAKAAQEPISFVLMLGDNFYESGVTSVTDPQWTNAFVDMYHQPSLQVGFYAVLGNHDYRSNPQAQIDYTRLSQRWRMLDRYYTVVRSLGDSASVQFFFLDTNPLAYLSLSQAKALSDTGIEMRQIRWFDRQLNESTAQWKIVLGHHTIYSGGEHGDNESMRYLLEPLLTKYKVDFYLAGHDHDLELLKSMNGVHYVVSGAGGKHRDVRWRENTLFAATNLGFTFFRISPNEAVIEFLSRNGSLEYARAYLK
jgi:tartrate-resistant acid phosphatase type 5